MDDKMRDAAARAVVFQVLEQAAKQHKDAAKAELGQLQPGDTIGGSWDGQLLGKATMTNGKSKIVIVNDQQYLEWVRQHHDTEIVESVNPAFMQTFKVVDGQVIDALGEIVCGVQAVSGSPYVSVRKQPDAPFLVAQLLSAGRVSLDGIKELEA